MSMLVTPNGGHPTKICIIDIVNAKHEIEVDSETTGYVLKEIIYNKICKELKAFEMILTYQGEELNNGTKISQFNIAIGNLLIFKQQKIPINAMRGIQAHNIQDPISCQSILYQWPCGHYIGQEGIVAHVRATISNNQLQIRCPYQGENGDRCNYEWDYKICKKIGVFSAQERKEFQKGFSEIYKQQSIKKCPKCLEEIAREGEVMRVRCPYSQCKYGDFCFRCLGPWIDPKSTTFCGSETCRFAFQYLANAPWNREFILTDLKTKKSITVKTPQYRACPQCSAVIQNYSNCKHTKCINCKKEFCFVCLSVRESQWKCGGYGEYCGKVAQVQKYQPGKN